MTFTEGTRAGAARVAVWSATSALLRGDRDGAVFLADETGDPVMTLVAAGALADVLRLYSCSGAGPRAVQKIMTDELERLAVVTIPA
jgi:hypothetical protein